VTGGQDDGSGEAALSSVEKYSPSSDTWSAVAPLPEARSGHAAVAVGLVMYVLSGCIDADTNVSVLKFDSTQGTWIQVAPMPQATFVCCVCHRERHLCVWRIKRRRFSLGYLQVRHNDQRVEHPCAHAIRLLSPQGECAGRPGVPRGSRWL
jgi:hypothetical protein